MAYIENKVALEPHNYYVARDGTIYFIKRRYKNGSYDITECYLKKESKKGFFKQKKQQMFYRADFQGPVKKHRGPLTSSEMIAMSLAKKIGDNFHFKFENYQRRDKKSKIVSQIKENVLSMPTVENYNMDRPYNGTKVQQAQIRNQMINRMRNEFMYENPYTRS
ncbi:hypothetical protein LJC18_00220 [Lachnospiraceae bacterium OttesenSCG-928-E19]|nr:hypothetical protein [Lachnospiraceae bacterium OttesenSCG-928-E19]